MSKVKDAAKAKQNAGANGAAETTTATTGANVDNTNNESTEAGTEGTEGTEWAGSQPAAPAPAAIKATKKQPPLKTGKRGGGAGSRISGGRPTYNFAEAAYGDVTGFLRHILNGCYVPVYNGYPGYPEQFDLPKYASLEAAAKANAVIFGYREDLTHFIGYKQNNQLQKLGVTQLTSVPDQKYHCFLTASSMEDIAKAKENLAAYEAMLWNAGNKSMVSKWLAEPYNLTIPSAPALLGSAPAAAPAAPAADANKTEEPANA